MIKSPSSINATMIGASQNFFRIRRNAQISFKVSIKAPLSG
jgi:hypothetical protein